MDDSSTPCPHTPPPDPAALESSLHLLRRASNGDRKALDRLYERHQESIRRWIHGRLPASARDRLDADAVLREAFAQALENLDAQEPGTFWDLMRQMLLERIEGALRHEKPPVGGDREGPGSDADMSAEEEAVGRTALHSYDRALRRLDPVERQALVMRIEMGCSYEDIAATLGKPSEGAARMTVCRVLVRLAQEMSRGASAP
ncbi:MAG: RNA polymerase sigma factor [Candidatus Krumholzibacteriia bacterium]